MGKRASLEGIVEAGWNRPRVPPPWRSGPDTRAGSDVPHRARVADLDVAAGTGTSASALATRLDADVVALDISAAMIERVDAKRGRRGAVRNPSGARRRRRAAVRPAVIRRRRFGMHPLPARQGTRARGDGARNQAGGMGGDTQSVLGAPCVGPGPPPASPDRGRGARDGGRLATAVHRRRSRGDRGGRAPIARTRNWNRRMEQNWAPGARLRLAARAVGRWGPRSLANLLRASRLLRSRSVGYVVMAGRKSS